MNRLSLGVRITAGRPSMKDDRFWMGKALDEAHEALLAGEVPIGAVVVHEGEIVGRGHNLTGQTGSPFDHAEMVALRDAVANKDWRILCDSVVYVTVEPCIMCVGAMVLARVPKVVFGAREPKTGACESVLSIPNESSLERRMTAVGGVDAERCAELLQMFFRKRREARPATPSE